jgi:hypothetical protein
MQVDAERKTEVILTEALSCRPRQRLDIMSHVTYIALAWMNQTNLSFGCTVN